MKRIILMICSMLALLPALLTAQPNGASGNWNLIFEDNFNGNSLDNSKWTVNYPWGNGHRHNHEAWCVAEQVSVQNGMLRITATNQKHPNSEPGYNWTSGVITSSGKFHMSGGFLEGRFRVPPTLGTWPAFWTLGNGWPPEIDVLEVPHERNKYYYNLHYTNASGNHASFGGSRTGPDLSAGWHIYGVEWDVNENYIRFYFDGQLVASYNNRPEVAQAVNQYILINLAVGGWGGTPASGPWPAYYDCDWVRAWQKAPATYYRLRNRATGLFLDGMGHTANGDACGQYANTTHVNAQWQMNNAGSTQGTFYYFQNRGTGLKLDGMGRTTNGSDVGQYAITTTHINSQWTVQQYSGNYYRIQNRGTGLYLDGMGRTSNGAACGQWANTTSNNAQWELVPVASGARMAEDEPNISTVESALVQVYPNPGTSIFNIEGLVAGNYEFNLYNLNGNKMATGTVQQGTMVVPVTISSGTYILQINDNEKIVLRTKIIIQN